MCNFPEKLSFFFSFVISPFQGTVYIRTLNRKITQNV